ncbi:uncharacterized protein [Montipora capricornis]|uniref:uncharacterized protein n=1 Tax=Montipora foliosa TaxID=591990 RepID=UPI0035F1FA82
MSPSGSKSMVYERFFQGLRPKENLQSNRSSFSQQSFENETSLKIREAAKESKFIQGMAAGTLAPDDYGGYMVQDAAYCFNAVEAFNIAANSMQEKGSPEFALLYRVQSESYKKYNQEFVKSWRIKGPESLVMGPAAATYVGYESALARKDPKFLAIAMLPCALLWPWIAGELIDSVPKENPYFDWFDDNKPDDQKSRLEKFVDNFFSPVDSQKALLIFHEGLINELNFFRDACDETLYYYSFFNV